MSDLDLLRVEIAAISRKLDSVMALLYTRKNKLDLGQHRSGIVSQLIELRPTLKGKYTCEQLCDLLGADHSRPNKMAIGAATAIMDDVEKHRNNAGRWYIFK